MGSKHGPKVSWTQWCDEHSEIIKNISDAQLFRLELAHFGGFASGTECVLEQLQPREPSDNGN